MLSSNTSYLSGDSSGHITAFYLVTSQGVCSRVSFGPEHSLSVEEGLRMDLAWSEMGSLC